MPRWADCCRWICLPLLVVAVTAGATVQAAGSAWAQVPTVWAQPSADMSEASQPLVSPGTDGTVVVQGGLSDSDDSPPDAGQVTPSPDIDVGDSLSGAGEGEVVLPFEVQEGFDVTEGLAPDLLPEEIEGHELGSEPLDLSIAGLLDDDGIFEWRDGDDVMSLRRLPVGEAAAAAFSGSDAVADSVAAATALQDLAASAAVSYVPVHDGLSNETSAVVQKQADNWFVSDTGQLFLPVGGVLILFDSGINAAAVDAIWSQFEIAPGRVSAVEGLPNAFKIDTSSDVESLQLVRLLSQAPGVESVTPNMFTPDVIDSTESVPMSFPSLNATAVNLCSSNDPPLSDALSACLWHLDHSNAVSVTSGGQTYAPLVDINIGDVWETTKGEGVTVSIVDGTWTASHEDLVGNANRAASTYWGGLTGENSSRSSLHATAVAGIIGARDNTIGGRGVAPRASLLNVNFVDRQSSYNRQQAFLHRANTVAVANHSYGKSATGGLSRWSRLTAAALEQSLESGFGGKGTVHVKGVGNGKNDGVSDEASLAEESNHYGLIMACAVNSAGTDAAYSEEGPNLWVCGPSGDSPRHGLLSTVGKNHYHSGLRGTSFSAPVVSGVAALVRSANTNLTWRDVKLILANTAQKNDSSDSSWQSGALKYDSTTDSYSYSRKYGFGLVDASAAVTAAQNWKRLPPMIAASASSTTSGDVSKSSGAKEFPIALSSDISFVEHVDVNINMSTPYFRSLKLTLISPTGKESVLVNPAASRRCTCSLYGGFKFGSARHLGETATGIWKLKVENTSDLRLATLNSWGITVYGHNPLRTEVVSLTTSGGTTEGGDISFSVKHKGATLTSDLVVPISLTSDRATPPGQPDPDYTALTSITIPAGSSTASATISTTDDNTHELTETIIATIGTLKAPYTSDGIVKRIHILDDDQPQVSIKTIKNHINEGEAASFEVTMDRDPAVPMKVLVHITEHDLGAGAPSSVYRYLPRNSWHGLIFKSAGSLIVSVKTTLDRIDDPQREIKGSLPIFLIGATAYDISGPQSVRVRVSDDLPRVSVVSDGDVDEGADASFTLEAFPVPNSALTVPVTIAESGYFGVDTSIRSVTIGSSGTAKLVIPTVHHPFTQPDGAVTVTVQPPADNSYYPIPQPDQVTATAAIADIDSTTPTTTPVVIITGGAGVTEGDTATFTLRALPATVSDLDVNVAVTVVGSFDTDTGTQTVTIPANDIATLTVPTRYNGYDGIDGLLIVTVVDDTSYDVYSKSSASVAVADSDTGVPSSAVSIASDADITEGATASFTLTANPAPTTAFDVDVMVQSVGDYGVSTGTRKVTIPTGGLVRLGITTINDSAVELPGSITVTLVDGTSYDLDLSASEASVLVSDDDTPFVGIAANSRITEGSDAAFTLNAYPLPPAAFDVSVALTVDGDFGITASTQIITIPVTGSASLALTTTEDAIYESDGSVTATIVSGTGYYPNSSASTATVYIADNDDPLTPQARTELITDVRSYAAETNQSTDHVNRWKQALLSLGEKVPGFTGTPITALQAFDYANQFSHTRWNPVVAALQKIETAKGIRTVPTSGVFTTRSNITEGYSATFWLTQNGSSRYSPQAKVRITTTGDYGITSGIRTFRLTDFGVGTAVLLATTDDLIDEPDGSVTVEVIDGIGYIPSSSSSATVFIADNDVPKVSVTADGAITEGDSATFTLKASPVPSAELDVTVNVSVSGDYGVTAGSQTVTIPTSGTATLTLATTGDSVDEADGSVTVALIAGKGYTLNSAASSATVAVADDDGLSVSPSQSLTPEVSIAAGNAVTEGSNASFTLTANPAPASALDVSVNITASGSYGVTTGSRTVTIGTSGTATLTVATSGDSTDEADGSVTVTINADISYSIDSSASAATVNVADDDASVVPAKLIADVKGYAAETINGVAHVNRWKRVLLAFGESVPGFTGTPMTVTEAQGFANQFWSVRWDPVVTALQALAAANSQTVTTPTVSITAGSDVTEGSAASFTVAATPAPSSNLDVTVNVAASGSYGVTTGSQTVTIPTSGTAILTVATSGDTVDEADGSVTVTINTGSNYSINSSASTATVNITDDDAASVYVVPAKLISDVKSYAAETSNGVAHVTRWKRVLLAFGESVSGFTGIPMTVVEAQENAIQFWNIRWDPVVIALQALAAANTQTTPTTPQVSIIAGGNVIEGSNATFTLAANPVPSANLDVSVNVTAAGAYGVTTGSRTVTIGTSGTATLTVATSGDSTDEADGSVTATLVDGAAYDLDSSASTATVNISDDDVPEVSVAAGSDVTEGTAASFTLTANPAPASALDVSVNITASGSYGVTTGNQTVTIPVSGTATLTVATSGDSIDEADGSVTATLVDGAAYNLDSSASAATVNISDDDDPIVLPPPTPATPVVGVTAGNGITEGGTASFTLTANPAPSANLDVTVTVSATGVYGVTTGSRTVTIATSGTATLTVATTGDSTDETDGSVTATLVDGAAYDLDSSASSATVAISDDDAPVPPPASVPPADAITVSVDEVVYVEGQSLIYVINFRLSKPASKLVTVKYTTGVLGSGAGYATEGEDFMWHSGFISFSPGDTEATGWILAFDDSVKEPDETFTIVLSEPQGGVYISDKQPVLTIKDND